MTLKDIFSNGASSWLVPILLVICGIALGRWIFPQVETKTIVAPNDSVRVIVQAEVAKQGEEIRKKLEDLRVALLNRQFVTKVTVTDTTSFNRRLDSLLAALRSGGDVDIEVGSGMEAFPVPKDQDTTGVAQDSVLWTYYGKPLSIASIELRRAPRSFVMQAFSDESLWGGLFVETGAYAQIGKPFKPFWSGLTIYPELNFGKQWSVLPKLTGTVEGTEFKGLGEIKLRYKL
jgi:hypothetical protein